VIIGLLAALVGPTLYQRISPAKRNVARAQIENFMGALDAYYIDVGEFPSSEQGLESLRSQSSNANGWLGPYLKKAIPLDPWGTPYLYRSPGRNGGYEIVSFGRDNVEGGSEENQDINSWEGDQ